MAVRKGDRDQGKLQCLEASKELIKYTYDRVKDNRGNSYYQQQRMTEFYYSEKARLMNGYYNQRTTSETGE